MNHIKMILIWFMLPNFCSTINELYPSKLTVNTAETNTVTLLPDR